MVSWSKNWLWLIKKVILFGFVLCTDIYRAQGVANYVSNGGFELCAYCTATPAIVKPKYWDAIDTTKFFGILFSAIIPPYLVPYNSFATQWPKGGNNYLGSSVLFKPFTPQTERGYPRNRLKQKLIAGKVYCVKFYYNVTEQSSYGINSLGAFLGDGSTDTISQCMAPISYLNPQISISSNIFIQDTAKWNTVSGTFTANGTEEYLILGNFKSDSNTDTIMINPANLPLKFTDVLYDDVSCIDIDLPAYAGPDKPVILGDSVYIGRERDIEIDESCIWYQMTSPTTSITIDTIAGMWVKPVSTTTYVVRQQLWCSGVKSDTVVVYIDAVGLEEVETYLQDFNLFPNPAADFIKVQYSLDISVPFNGLSIFNNLGQLIREEEITFKNKKVNIPISELDNGVYFLELRNFSGQSVKKRFVVAR
ncbi:MAG: T9SS type A sorting domain-containing protein [Bacteroidia bacterium]|jgi:hypothetical protein|nr:T9SS type A sorting domain-containing protein [Bacteroidia bacterium]